MKNSILIEMLEEKDLAQYKDLSFVAETCGLDLVKRLLSKAEGFDIHIPQIKNITPLVRRYIQQNFKNGKDPNKIAAELGITPAHVKRIINLYKNTTINAQQ